MNKRVPIIYLIIAVIVITAATGVAIWFISRQGIRGRATGPVQTATAVPTETQAPTDEPTPEPIVETTAVPFHIAASSLGDISVAALSLAPDSGVAVNSGFLVQTSRQVSRDVLFGQLSMKSTKGPVTFSLIENNTDEFLLTPDEPLIKDEIYSVVYAREGRHPLSFAFQTEQGFRITSTVPGRDTYSVPVDTGIEISFSAELENGLENYFSITPRVNGRWLQSGSTYIFVPNALKQGTYYDVKIKGGANGVSDINGNTLEEDYSFRFSTVWGGNSGDYCDIFGDSHSTFLPDDEPHVELSLSETMTDSTFKVDIYALNNPEEFINEDVSSATFIESFETKLAVIEGGYQRRYFINIGHTLDEGYYAVDFYPTGVTGDYNLRKFIQVSPLSVYALSVGGGMVVWVNDTETGAPVSWANVRLSDGTHNSTSMDGFSMLPAAAGDETAVYIDDGIHKTFAYRMQTYAEPELAPTQRYYSYLYTDRSAYMPNDTVNVFGVINARRPEFLIKDSDEVTLRFGDMREVPVTLDGYGCFEASFEAVNMFNYVSIDLYVNGEWICSDNVSFMEYDREKYNFSLTTDRKVYFLGETVEVTASVTTLDGAPVEGMSISGVNDTVRMTTGRTGQAGGSYDARAWEYQGYQSWEPSGSYEWFRLRNRDEYLQDATINTVVLPSTVMLEYEKVNDTTISFNASMIDRDALEAYLEAQPDPYFSSNEDVYRGEPADLSFKLHITKNTTVRRQTGSYYDFIQKRDVPIYDYDYVNEEYRVVDFSTVNGKATVTGLPVSDDPMVYYTAEVRFYDTVGTPVRTNVSLGAIRYFDLGIGETFSLAADKTSLGLQETTTLRLTSSRLGEGEAIEDGRMLIIPATNAIMGMSVGSPAGIDFTFFDSYIYNITIFGAYFDGTHIYAVDYPTYIYYDYEEAGLNFDLAFDKNEYLPGDTVNAEISVTDKDGKPVQARLNVSVVDEAVLRAHPNNPGILSTYYGGAYNSANEYDVYSSYQPIYEGGYGGAEKGNGGEEAAVVRDDFDDNPAFIPIETNSDGRGNITFVLSDAVTSWRLTTHGVTEDGLMGDNKTNITATLPFYTDLVMTSTFLTGDEVAALVKPHGEKYRFNRTQVSYRAELLKNNAVVASFEDASAAAITVNFGEQTAGDYTLRVSAEAEVNGGVLTDAIEEQIRVVESDTLLTLSERHTLDEANPVLLTDYAGMASPVNVTLTNADIMPLLDIMYSGVDYNSNRTDYMAGNAYARAFWERLDGRQAVISLENEPALARVLSTQSNGIPEVDYGSAEMLYTARFVAALPELVKANEIINYINYSGKVYEYGGNTLIAPGDAYLEAERAAGYLALAALRQPVLLEIKSQIALIENDYDQARFSDTYEGRLRVMFYAAALCAIGDDANAAFLIDKYCAAPLESLDETKTEMLNALQLFCQSVLDAPAAFAQLTERKEPNKFVSDVLERIHFLKTAVPVSGAVSEVSYTLDGVTETATLNNFDCVYLSVTAEQYAALNVNRVSGNTNVDVSFSGSPANLPDGLNSIKITKTIEPYENYDGLYRVTISLLEDPSHKLDDGKYYYYTIYDRVPSNMRFTEPRTADGDRAWATVEGQRVRIWAYTRGNQTSYSFYYYTMRISDAEAVIPEAYISRSFNLANAWGSAK